MIRHKCSTKWGISMMNLMTWIEFFNSDHSDCTSLYYSPTCLYTSTKVCAAASLTGPIGSPRRFTMGWINDFKDRTCVPCLKIVEKKLVLIKCPVNIGEFFEAYMFNVLTIVCKNSSRTLAFLCLKQVVNLSSSCCGRITRHSISLYKSSCAFSRTVSRLSPSRSTTCGKIVGVYAAKSGPSRLISSMNASNARCAI